MNSIYDAPESDLINQVAQRDFKLYKVTGIGIATIIGSPVAGGFLISRNYKALGMESQAKKAIIYSIIGTFLFIALTFAIEVFVSLPDISYSIPQVVAVVMLTKQFQGTWIDEHRRSGGAFFSNWRALGIALLILLAVFAVLVPVFMLSGVVA